MDLKERLKGTKARVVNGAMSVPALRQREMQALLRRPGQLCIETTSNCNAACPMCPRDQMRRPMELMPRAMYERIIDEAAEWGIERVYLQFYGDPLFMPDADLEYYLSVARKCRYVAFSTNGQLLTRKKAEIIIRNGVNEIQVDFDAADKQTYEQIRINCNYDKVAENLRGFMKLRTELGQRLPRVLLGAVVMPVNERQIPTVVQQWKDIVDGFALGPMSNRGGTIDAPDGRGGKTACWLPWHQLNVASDGSVALCCNDWDVSHPIGNVNDSSLHAIWYGQALGQVRETMVTGEGELPPICQSCNAWRQYGPQWWHDRAGNVPYAASVAS